MYVVCAQYVCYVSGVCTVRVCCVVCEGMKGKERGLGGTNVSSMSRPPCSVYVSTTH